MDEKPKLLYPNGNTSLGTEVTIMHLKHAKNKGIQVNLAPKTTPSNAHRPERQMGNTLD